MDFEKSDAAPASPDKPVNSRLDLVQAPPIAGRQCQCCGDHQTLLEEFERRWLRSIRELQPSPFGRMPEEGFVRLPVVLSVYPISPAAWWEGIRRKDLPRGVKLTERITGWDVKAIRALIAAKAGKG